LFQAEPHFPNAHRGSSVRHACCRRPFALNLALRLLARIALLDLAVFFIWRSDFDGIASVETEPLPADISFTADVK
jgi:hypothetical protein